MLQIVNIQFLRAVAALAVLVYHFSLQYQVINNGTLNNFFQLFNWIGYAGVDFFFVISGYIMWITTRKISKAHPVAEFIYKRLTRIFLGYWPYFFLALLFIALFPHILPKGVNLLGSFFLSEPHTHKLLIQVAWTLQFELYFYFLFALLLLLPVQHRLWVILAFSLTIIVYQFFIPTHVGFSVSGFLLSPFCLEFFAGCLLGFYFEKHRVNYKIVLLLGLALLGFAVLYQSQIINHSLVDNNHLPARIAIYGTAATLIMAALIEMEKHHIQLLKRLSIILGGSSYSIYLSHSIAIALVYVLGWQAWVQHNSQSPGWWIALFMLLTVLYSVIHYLWVEKPLMTLAGHFRKRLFK